MGGCRSTGSRLVNFKQISRQLSMLELLELKRGSKWISVNIDDDDDIYIIMQCLSVCNEK